MTNKDNYQAKKSTLIEETLTAAKRSKEEEEVRAKAARLGLSYVNLSGFPINNEVITIFKESEAQKYKAVPYLRVGDTVRVASTNPKDESLISFLNKLKKKKKISFLPVITSLTSLNFGLSLYKTAKRDPEKKEKDVVEISKKKFDKEIRHISKIKKHLEHADTTQVLDILLSGGVGLSASDIHIVPSKKEAEVRLRIDGVLQKATDITYEQYKKLLSRIKYLSHMEMAKAGTPQDGRFSSVVAKKTIDIRVSTLPTIHGDSIVLRLLEEDKKFLGLEDLGFPKDALFAINKAISQPSGLILNTGPTGSGKTTTLYAIIKKLINPEKKIVTLEDPVEYKIKGIEQTQIDDRHDFSFAKALRSTLRQDPDIIMVGEIRDFETASIALHSVLTGHLILSTLHTNSAPAALVRLLDMKIRPFLLAGSVNLVIAQRLVRLICKKCKKEYKPSKQEEKIIKDYLKKVGKKRMPKLYTGEGCETCHNTGFSGRIAIIEYFKPDEKMEKLITEETTKTEVERAAIKGGMKTMREDGIEKVLQGITTIGEVLKVTQEY